MTKLSVNLNKVALIRNSRDGDFPDLLEFASICIEAGAHGVTIHPRPDQRHARYADVAALSGLLSRHPQVELNIEGNPTQTFLDVVLEHRPTQCTLVPDEPDQLTSDHGWDAVKHGDKLTAIVERLREAGIRCSLFLDPDTAQLKAARDTGTDRIELYTEAYARAFATDRERVVLEQYRATAHAAQALGLGVNAGHDLNQQNLAGFLSIPDILEVSIGHALTVEALVSGFEAVIRAYLDIIEKSRG